MIVVLRKRLFGIVVLAILAGFLCGAFPAWRSSRVPAVEVLKEESANISGGSRNRHVLSGLVVMQIAVSLIGFAAMTAVAYYISWSKRQDLPAALRQQA